MRAVDPFTRSATYAAAIGGASFSPSAAIRSTVSTAAPSLAGATTVSQRVRFVEQIIRTAGAVVTAYNGGEAFTVSTEATATLAGSALLIDPEQILQRGHADPAAAADYATGRLLTAASATEQMLAREVRAIRASVSRSRSLPDWRHDHRAQPGEVVAVDEGYSAAHLAAGVAAIRGRERVLAKWPGWAGYFAAAETTEAPRGLADYATNPAHPPIRRVAASIMARLNCWTVPEDPTLADAITAGEDAARRCKWKRGEMVADAERVISAAAALLPKPEPQEPPKGGAGQGEGQPNGDPDAIPGSEAEEMQGNPHQPSMGNGRLTEEIKPSSPDRVAGEDGAGEEFKVHRYTTHPDSWNLRHMRERAAPLLAAVRRVAWDTLRPPQFDRGQHQGELDEGAMHRLAAWADPEVFEVREDEGRGRVAVHLLVDCSGSMASGGRIDDARAVAYSLAVAFSQHPRYTLRITGHDVGYGPTRLRLWECKTAEAISGLEGRGDNADGYAIHAAMRDIEAVPADRRVVMLIADGQPNARGYGSSRAERHIRAVVEAGARRGTQFLALGIDGAMAHDGGAMFGPRRFVSLPDTRSAGPLLARAMARMGAEVQA